MVRPVGFGSDAQPYRSLDAVAAALGGAGEVGGAAPQSPADRAEMLEDLTAQAAEGAKPKDVGAMSSRQASAEFDQISLLKKINAFQYMGVTATYKGEKTGDLDTYMGWLEQRFTGEQGGGVQASGAPVASADSANPIPPADNDLADVSPARMPAGEGRKVETVGDTASSGTKSFVGLKADDPAGLEPEGRVPAPRGSAYASIARMQATTATASQVVAELSNLAARVVTRPPCGNAGGSASRSLRTPLLTSKSLWPSASRVEASLSASQRSTDPD